MIVLDRIYEVRSGRPPGEVYDRAVVMTDGKAMAETVERLWAFLTDNKEWLWGPRIFPLAGDVAKVWNGHEEVEAPRLSPSMTTNELLQALDLGL